MDIIYVGTSGTNCILTLGHGSVTAIHYSPIDRTVDGAFVKLDSGEMCYVTTGAHGENDRWRQVVDCKIITMEEFDVLSGLAAFRKELGWR